MLVSLKWLQQYLPNGLTVTPEELSQRLTQSLAEVEGIEYLGHGLEKIVAGEIKKVKKHPKANKLLIAEVDTSEENPRTIVCGASNIGKGMKVPVALPGGKVYNPESKQKQAVNITERVVKGVKSEGMLCSERELGVGENHEGIWILPEDTKVGEDLVEMLQDIVIEIENKELTHRPECFSHVGIAREIAAITKSTFEVHDHQPALAPVEKLPVKVKVETSKLCPRYTAIVIKDIKVKPSPLWLQNRLRAVGVRPINNLVDITNYIMMDIGQPLHAFDYDKVKNHTIIVRTAKPREKIVTLDEAERELGQEMLLIADPEKAIGIAGLMGAANTEVSKDTKAIILESANFEMYNNRGTSRKLGLRTEASTRFEKGQDPEMAKEGLERAIELILDLCEGEIASEVIDIYPEPREPWTVEIELANVKRLLGIELEREEVIKILESLQLEIVDKEKADNELTLKIPTFRPDLKIEADIMEEIARIHGYDKFNPTLPPRDLKPAKKNKIRDLEKKIKATLSSLGMDEIYTYAFVGEEDYRNTEMNIDDCIKLKNPIAPELGWMRTSLIPSLLSKVELNLTNFNSFNAFEVSKVYFKKGRGKLPDQPRRISGLSVSKEVKKGRIYYLPKGVLERLFETLIIKEVRYEQLAKSRINESWIKTGTFHPSRSAVIKARKDKKDITIGIVGEIHPIIKHNWDIKAEVAAFELDFEALKELAKESRGYKRISNYPAVTRDLSFYIDPKQEVQPIIEKLNDSNIKELANIEILDIFEEKKRKSITLRATIQADKTLKDKEIEGIVKEIVETIRKEFGGKLRKR